MLSLTPPAMLQLVNHRRIRETDLSSVVLTGSGAAHLPPKLAKTFQSMLKNAENVGEGETLRPSQTIVHYADPRIRIRDVGNGELLNVGRKRPSRG